MQWVRAIGPVDGVYLFGSDADFCNKCGKMAMQRTNIVAENGEQRVMEVETVLEEVQTTKTYDVKASVWCGGRNHTIWEVGAKHGSMFPDPFEGLTKLKGEGGRLRITMKVEVLRTGKVTKPFHPRGCHACGTKGARNMHILMHGLPLCRFSTEVPRDWPRGHWWAGLNMRDVPKVNCRVCLKRAAPQCHEELRKVVEETLAGLGKKRCKRRS